MKKIFAFALVLVCVHLMMVQSAQAQENTKVRKMLVGIWKIYDLESPDMYQEDMSEEEKKMMEDEMKEMREKSSFNFMQDGKYVIKTTMMGQENKETGTWKVEGDYLVTISTEGNESRLEILEKTKAMVIFGDGEIKLTLVSKYFKE